MSQPITESVRRRFEANVVRSKDPAACWGWTGTVSRGRARLSAGNGSISARRVAWAIRFASPPPEKFRLRSTCGNDACCNPDHLFVGTNEMRFWHYVEKTPTCWLWRGTLSNRRDYGQFSVTREKHGDQDIPAHRFAYELAYGVSPAELFVCHRCDVPLCVRPDHLFLGTNADNIADMIAKGRNSKGEKHAAIMRAVRARKSA